jgi:hypothetical protein
MAFAMTYITLGLLHFIFAHEFAGTINRFAFRFCEFFPALKRPLPSSGIAGTDRNYKSLYYFAKIFGAFMVIAGDTFLGMALLR